MYKGLVTSGCSFSLWDAVDGHGWPYYLQQQLLSDGMLSKDFSSFHRGLGSNGNMLIARNTVEAISRLLDNGIESEEILCVVQWSAINRHQFFLEDAGEDFLTDANGQPRVFKHNLIGKKFVNGVLEVKRDGTRILTEEQKKSLLQKYHSTHGYNKDYLPEGEPVPIIDRRSHPWIKRPDGYHLINQPSDWSWWKTEDHLDKQYFKYFHSIANDVIESLWNWITLQNYCEVNNVKIFYTFMFEHDKEMLLDDEVGSKWAWEYMRKGIKRDNVLTSITEYLESFETSRKVFIEDGHPSTTGHKIFSDYLKKSLTNT